MAINFIPPELRTAERDDAFWNRIDRQGNDDCWLWKIETQLTQGGYGSGFYATIHTVAHRIAYMLMKGPIPEGLQILHICDKKWLHDPKRGRRCCNPYHLYAGTPQDNMDDKVKLGRQYRPSTYRDDGNPNARLRADQIPQIFEDAKTMSQRKIAAKYGVSKSQIGYILNGISRPNAVAADQRGEAVDAMNKRRRGLPRQSA